MALGGTKGIILFTKDFKEEDKLVKIFTGSYGKLMFPVKGAHRKNNPLLPAILPFTEAVYIRNFREEGLSFLNSSKEAQPFRNIQQDISINAYGTYVLNLVDTATEDQHYDPNLFQFTHMALSALNEQKDLETITNIFGIQLLERFGVRPEWHHCVACGETQGKFGYSSRYNGALYEKHWHLDEQRYHADPRTIHFIRSSSQVSYEKIQNIQVKEETKKGIRGTIDMLYDEYVGLHLRSKKLISQMKTWESTLEVSLRKKKEKET